MANSRIHQSTRWVGAAALRSSRPLLAVRELYTPPERAASRAGDGQSASRNDPGVESQDRSTAFLFRPPHSSGAEDTQPWRVRAFRYPVGVVWRAACVDMPIAPAAAVSATGAAGPRPSRCTRRWQSTWKHSWRAPATTIARYLVDRRGHGSGYADVPVVLDAQHYVVAQFGHPPQVGFVVHHAGPQRHLIDSSPMARPCCSLTSRGNPGRASR